MVLPVNVENITEEMKALKNWVLWKLKNKFDPKTQKVEIDPETGQPKKTKIPYQINGKPASSTDPLTWGTFEDVLNAFLDGKGKYSGIGFCLTEEAGYIGIDWDKVRDPITGEWNKEALEEILSLYSYGEVSQSGTGAHVLMKGKHPGDKKRTEDIEIYSGMGWNEEKQKMDYGRYFIVTGQHIKGTPREITENQEAINKLYEKRFGEEKKEEKKSTPTKAPVNLRSPDLTDDEVLQLCRAAANKTKFVKLYDKGQISGYHSQSEARLALCDILGFYTQKKEQIYRLFSKSKLFGEDWIRKSQYDIAKVLVGRDIVYNPSEYKKKDNGETPEDRVKKYPEQIQEYAYKLLKEGDPFKFILETWNLRHVGDKNLGENCLCSAASTFILNSDMGLHIKPSGESGKGKSDAMQEILKLLPAHKYITGSLSGKALFYDPNLKSGTIIYSDDAFLTNDLIATIKQSTSKFQERTIHRTVKNQTFATYPIPERCCYWFSSVDGISDEQLANRFLNADVDGSREQDLRVEQHIKDKESIVFSPVDDDVLICQCIFDILDIKRYDIRIPFTKAIVWRNAENRRNLQKFLDIIRAVTFFNVFQREEISDSYMAEYEDFERALDIYVGTSKNNATNLTALEIKVFKFIADGNEYKDGKITKLNQVTIKELINHLKVSRGRVHHILHGKDGNGGILAKVAYLNKINRSVTTGGQDTDKVTTQMNQYVYTGPQLGLEIYDTVATLDRKESQQFKKEFIKTFAGKGVIPVTHCYPHVTLDEVTPKTNTVDRINNNVT